MPLNFNRYHEVPDRAVLESLLLQTMRRTMPQAGAQGFSAEALHTGEVARLLQALLAPFVDTALELKRFGRQLTFSDVQEEFVDVKAASLGLPARYPGEVADDYVWRVLNQLLIAGRTMPAIQENLALLGFEAELYPMAGRLLVASKAGRVPSTSRGLLPNARTKAGVYGVELWGPTNNTAGVTELLMRLTSAGYAYRLRVHVHWNLADTVVLTPVPNFGMRRRLVLPVFRLDALTPSMAVSGAPSRAPYPPSGRKRTYGVGKRRRTGIVAEEANVLAYLPVRIDTDNRYLAIDWGSLTGSNLSYNLVDEPLRVDSRVSVWQAGPVITQQ